MKEGYLRILDSLANYELPLVAEEMDPIICSAERRLDLPAVPPALVRRVSTVWSWDATHMKSDLPRRGREWIITNLGSSDIVLHIKRESIALSTVFAPQDDDRIQQLVSHMERDPQVVLARIIFEYNSTFVLSICATLRFLPDAPEHRRYSITNSVFVLQPWEWAYMVDTEGAV